jgi:nucleoside-diphosphate-sugar epimerase
VKRFDRPLSTLLLRVNAEQGTDTKPPQSLRIRHPERVSDARRRILFAGASGVLGRATLPHLKAHHVVGLTRTADKLQLVRNLGVDAVVCDVYDADVLLRVTQRVRPTVVVNFLTDLSTGLVEANNRLRREGGANLLNAATAAGASRLVVESVAFSLAGDEAKALDELEEAARRFPGDAVILRFGRLWGPGTFYSAAPQPPAIHVEEAGAEAARLIIGAPSGTYAVT